MEKKHILNVETLGLATLSLLTNSHLTQLELVGVLIQSYTKCQHVLT
jgi:hypothetical protein